MWRNDKLWRCQGRDPCCYSQTPKNTPPCLQTPLWPVHSIPYSSVLPFLHFTLFAIVCKIREDLTDLWRRIFAYLYLCLRPWHRLSTFLYVSTFLPKDNFPLISICTYFSFTVQIPWLRVRSKARQMYQTFFGADGFGVAVFLHFFPLNITELLSNTILHLIALTDLAGDTVQTTRLWFLRCMQKQGAQL